MRSPRRLALAVLTAAVSGLLCGPVARALPVRITEADGPRVQVSLYPGDVLRVELPSQPAAGLQWALTGHPPPQLQKLAATQRVFGGRLSTQGASSFTWRAVSPGEADLKLDYGLPASRLTRPDRVVSVHVSIAAESAPAGTSDTLSQDDPQAQAEPAGTYTRTQPCADCSAVREQIVLYRADSTHEDISPAARFLLRRTYQDAPGGTLTVVAAGQWTTSKGTADPTATIYQLVGIDVAYLLRNDGDRLVPLDPQEIPLPSPAVDGAFHKVTEP